MLTLSLGPVTHGRPQAPQTWCSRLSMPPTSRTDLARPRYFEPCLLRAVALDVAEFAVAIVVVAMMIMTITIVATTDFSFMLLFL